MPIVISTCYERLAGAKLRAKLSGTILGGTAPLLGPWRRPCSCRCCVC